MNTYPSLPQALDSEMYLIDDQTLDRAANGTGRVRAFFTAEKHGFRLSHKMITAAEKASLLAFYHANRVTPFYFVWADDGVTYTVVFKSAMPSIKPAGNGAVYNATVVLEEV